jgi:hypothetical protein
MPVEMQWAREGKGPGALCFLRTKSVPNLDRREFFLSWEFPMKKVAAKPGFLPQAFGDGDDQPCIGVVIYVTLASS